MMVHVVIYPLNDGANVFDGMFRFSGLCIAVALYLLNMILNYDVFETDACLSNSCS